MQNQLKKNLLLLSFLLGLLGILALSSGGCAHPGPNVTICIVDNAHQAFQCDSEYPHNQWPVPFSGGEKLLCASPHDTETFFKACKAGLLISVPLCSIRNHLNLFECTLGNSLLSPISLMQAENYVCTSQEDYDRIKERCHS